MPQTAWQTVPAKHVRAVAKEKNIDIAIEKVAEDLVEGLVGPPTDLNELAKRLDVVDIRHDDTMVVPGELRELSGELVVFLMPGLTGPRNRFTLAHELGHAVFEKYDVRPRQSRELEILCDKFAAAFLMPRQAFRDFAGTQPNLKKIRELCRVFCTSLQATISRSVNIYSYRAFESRAERIVWKLNLNTPVLPEMRYVVSELVGSAGTEIVHLYENGYTTRWTLEWESLDSQDHRIGLLRPRRRFQR